MFKLKLVIVLLFVAVCESREFKNPIIREENRAKLIKYRSSYIIVTTNYDDDNNLFPIRVSTDLENWTNVGSVFTVDNRPTWNVNFSIMYDPFLHTDGRTFYVFFVGLDEESEDYKIGVAKSIFPGGPYTPEPKPLDLTLKNPFDPAIIIVPNNGDTYLIWHYIDTNIDTVWGQKIYLENLTLAEGGPVQLLTPMYPWQDSSIFAPNFLSRNNFFYIFYGANTECCTGAAIGVARSRFPLGPYIQLGTPLIADNATWPNVVEDVNGSSSYVLVYSINRIEHNPGENATTLLWGADDWPYVSYE